MTSPTNENPVIVVGGGLAGLTAALMLHRHGIPVTLLEASESLGGRVRTDRNASGYLLDRGFQVLLDAYPSVSRHVDLKSLNLGRFDAGAVVWDGDERREVASPFSEPASVVRSLRSGLVRSRDAVELARLALQARRATWASVSDAAGSLDDNVSIQEFLVERGFSDAFVNLFARPFWGGITLDHELSTSVSVFHFTLKMFLEGGAALPAAGMQALPEAFASQLPNGVVRTGTEVTSIRFEDGRACGVVAGAEDMPARAVIVAADPLSARRLTGIASIPYDGVGCCTYYLAGERDPGLGKKLLLNGSEQGVVNHVVPLSSVCPSYAPAGRHIVAAVVLSEGDARSNDLDAAVKREVAHLLRHAENDWELISIVAVPFSLFRQRPGFTHDLPANRTTSPGLYLAGDYTQDASINGAIISGEQAAAAAMADLLLERGPQR